MKHKVEQQHMIEIVFVLLLFSLLAFTSLSIVYAGSKVYSSTTDTMELNSQNNIALDYIREKVHQTDIQSKIQVQQIDNMDVLSMSETYKDEVYTTYIYCYKKQLKELFCKQEQPFSKEAGENIMKIDSLSMQIQQKILNVTLVNNKTTQKMHVSLGKGDRNL